MTEDGGAILRADIAATAVFAATAAAAVASDQRAVRIAAAAVALALFTAGTVAMAAAILRAISRSRTDEIGIGGLFFLGGDVAPPPVRRAFGSALAVQTVVALASASARPFTSLAFGVLVPVAGLGASGLWAARHGSFGRRARPAAGRAAGGSGGARGR